MPPAAAEHFGAFPPPELAGFDGLLVGLGDLLAGALLDGLAEGLADGLAEGFGLCVCDSRPAASSGLACRLAPRVGATLAALSRRA